jgi:hypothetical protein
MGPFDDDFFGGGIEELFNRLASEGMVEYTVDNNGKRKTFRKSKRDVFGKIFLDRITTSKRVYLIFDLSDRKEITAKVKEEDETKILEVKDKREHIFDFPLEEINTKNFEYEFKNGILEVSFRK